MDDPDQVARVQSMTQNLLPSYGFNREAAAAAASMPDAQIRAGLHAVRVKLFGA
jgi:hypothetical protein